ncbi:MAG: ribose-5-phosphate isomerase RpiA [Promethearchaeota archaeon]
MSVKEQKQRAAEAALAHVKNGMTIGIGTGSTVDIFIDILAKKVAKEKLSIKTVTSSYGSLQRLQAAGLIVENLASISGIPVAIDGADEVNPQLVLIKGGGAALLQEKILAETAEQFIVIVDQGKLVQQLGAKTPVPVEILPAALSISIKRIQQLGGKPTLRQAQKKAGPLITDNGNFILDAKFPAITDPIQLEKSLNAIPGVLENGIFPVQASIVYIGQEKGVKKLQR